VSHGFANDETYYFILHWKNDEPLYRDVLLYAGECLRRVPDMTDLTLGRNVKDTVRRWVADGEVVGLGWDEGIDYWPVDPDVLASMAREVGNFDRVSEGEVAEDVRDFL